VPVARLKLTDGQSRPGDDSRSRQPGGSLPDRNAGRRMVRAVSTATTCAFVTIRSFGCAGPGCPSGIRCQTRPARSPVRRTATPIFGLSRLGVAVALRVGAPPSGVCLQEHLPLGSSFHTRRKRAGGDLPWVRILPVRLPIFAQTRHLPKMRSLKAPLRHHLQRFAGNSDPAPAVDLPRCEPLGTPHCCSAAHQG